MRRSARGMAHPLPPLPITYGDYAHWQHGSEQAAERARRMAHWRKLLAAPPSAIDLPTDRPRPVVQPFRGAVRTFEVSSELVARLRSLGQREGATLYMVMLSALKVLLHRLTGQTDLAIGTASSGRDRSELQACLASSSTRWCCGPTSAAIPTSSKCCAACVRRRSRRPPTRCRSSRWCRNSAPSATSAATHTSRC